MDKNQLDPANKPASELTPWEQERDRLKLLLVIVVVIFWLSVIFQVVLYFIQDGRVNFILLSIISGMMVLGVILKTRFQWHLRKKVPK